MTVVLKLGGSVITEKDRPETLDGPALDAAADAIAAADVEDLVVVHGAGSFGHYHAEKFGVTTDVGTVDAVEVTTINSAMKTLNDFVVSRLHARNVPALPVHPLSAGTRDRDGRLAFPVEPVETMLGEGFVPVLHGDGVVHAGKGVSILSGDELVGRLAEDLGADRVGVCSTVPGVLDEDGEVVPEITAFEEVADALGGSDATDVSGGMAGKVRSLLELGVPAYVFGPDDLSAFLAGDSPGTRIATE